jgi:glutaredoxin
MWRRPRRRWGRPDGDTDGARVTVLSRRGCHLCDDAIAVVADVTRSADERYQVVDVDRTPGFAERYADKVPVVLVDGRLVGYWRVDAAALARELAR